MSAYDYRPILDDNMDTFPDPNLDSEPEETPPASQLEPRHKAELAKENDYKGKHLAQENLPRNSQSKRQPRKGKHEDAISALEFKKQKTETSILKLERHLEQKICSKSLQYKAKANVTPDETFRKEISAIKSHAEEQFVSALMRFHQRRLVSHKSKLEKANIVNSRSKNNVRNTREKPRSPLRNTVNTDVSRIDILENQLSELKDLICTRFQSDNKHVEKYNSVISEQTAAIPTVAERLSKNNKRKKRRKDIMQRRLITEREKNEKYLKNLSDHTLTDHQVSVLAKGLKFIETPVTNERKIRQQLLRDFEQFARRMRLRYIYHGNDKEPYTFHVRSNWIPPVHFYCP